MEWLVLRNRRHEGPFTESALKASVAEGRLSPDDYVITVAASESGDINYIPLKKAIKLPDVPVNVAPAATTPGPVSQMKSSATQEVRRDSLAIPPRPPAPRGQGAEVTDPAIDVNSLHLEDLVPVTRAESTRKKIAPLVTHPPVEPRVASPTTETKPDLPTLPSSVSGRAFPTRLVVGVALVGLAVFGWTRLPSGTSAPPLASADKKGAAPLPGQSAEPQDNSRKAASRSAPRLLKIPEVPDERARTLPAGAGASAPQPVEDNAAPLPAPEPQPAPLMDANASVVSPPVDPASDPNFAAWKERFQAEGVPPPPMPPEGFPPMPGADQQQLQMPSGEAAVQ
ncbi:MAG: hypothetical protein JST16_01425 [Bdellovibrionales bacterium]|nr:hypothetical protein [Bdellovibrionales bacterium]